MNKADRERLRDKIVWMKPGQHVEVKVEDLRALLERADRLEAELDVYRPPKPEGA